jgi:hypothetical protein
MRILVAVMVAATLASPALGQPYCSTDNIGNGSIGLFADLVASNTCISIPPGTGGSIYVFAMLDGETADGIIGAEFRVEVSNITGIFANWIANPAANVVLGSPLDGVGTTMAFPNCQVPMAGENRVHLGTLQLFNVSGSPQEFRVKRRNPPSSPNLGDCPLLIRCDEPTFTRVCLTPSTTELGREGVIARALFNDPLCVSCVPPYLTPAVGIFQDSLAVPNSLCTEKNVPRAFHLVGRVPDPPKFSPPGIRGARFRIEVPNPSGYFFSYTPPPGVQIFGDPIDATPQDPNDPAGITILFPQCTPDTPVPGELFGLGTLTVVDFDGGPTLLRVRTAVPAGMDLPSCPLFFLCDTPFNSPLCMSPTTAMPDIVFETTLNGLICEPSPFSPEAFLLDTHELTDDGSAGPVSTQQVLGQGRTFRIVVDGTVSTTSAASWISPPNVLCGVPEQAPQHVSPGVTNHWVGTDPEIHFAVPLPMGGDCQMLESLGYPRHHTRFQIDLGNGFEHMEPNGPIPTDPLPGHRYIYYVTGRDAPARFRWAEPQTSDNYGALRIAVDDLAATDASPPPPRAPRSAAVVVLPNRPDPFNPTTEFQYVLQSPTSVVVSVVDVRGKAVRHLQSGLRSAGVHAAVWNGRRDDGSPAASGVYLAVVKTPIGTDAERLTLIK